jgi:hypothetical protein
MSDFKDILEKGLGLKVFKTNWTEYEAIANGECLKVIFGENRGNVESVSMVLMPLESCSPEFLAYLLRNEVWIKRIGGDGNA